MAKSCRTRSAKKGNEVSDQIRPTFPSGTQHLRVHQIPRKKINDFSHVASSYRRTKKFGPEKQQNRTFCKSATFEYNSRDSVARRHQLFVKLQKFFV